MSGLGVEFEKRAVQGETSGSSVKKRVGVIATCALGGSLVALYAISGPFIAPALRKICLPFVPATNTQVNNVLRVLQSRSGTLVDIGSGDGRIVSHVDIKFNALEDSVQNIVESIPTLIPTPILIQND